MNVNRAIASRAALSVQKTWYNHEFVGYCCHFVTSSLYFGISDTTCQFNGQVVGHVSCSTGRLFFNVAMYYDIDTDTTK